MKKKKTIAFINNIPSPYNVDLFYELTLYFKNSYNLIHFFGNTSTSQGRKWKINNNKLINTEYLKSLQIKLKQKYNLRYIQIPYKLFKAYNNKKIDLFICSEYNLVSILTLTYCKIHKIKYALYTEGTLYQERNISYFQKIFRKVIINSADACLAGSTKSIELIRYYNNRNDNYFLCQLTVNQAPFNKINRKINKGKILYVGSVIERKGIDLLIEALAKVKHDFHLYIIGEADDTIYKKKLDILIEKHGLKENIFFCGYKEDLELLKEYENSELFILPSREDCYGLVLLESALSKVPIISSQYADGCFDVVKNGYNGYIVDPYNTDLFANIIHKSLDNNELQYNAKFNKNIKRFSYESVCKQYKNAINYIFNKKK